MLAFINTYNNSYRNMTSAVNSWPTMTDESQQNTFSTDYKITMTAEVRIKGPIKCQRGSGSRTWLVVVLEVWTYSDVSNSDEHNSQE